MRKIVLGTRGSKLALVQTKLVADAVREKFPDLDIETKTITTKGDVNTSPIPLDTVGKAWFTGEIEEELMTKKIDIAVHSLKDVPPDTSKGSIVLPVLRREDPRDVLVSKQNFTFEKLPQGAIVGTDSSRRKAQLLAKRPDLRVQSIRGNIDTRLRKLREEEYDAIVIAAAGLARLSLLDVVTEYFEIDAFVPAPGQGTLAAQARARTTQKFLRFSRLCKTSQRSPQRKRSARSWTRSAAAAKAQRAHARVSKGIRSRFLACSRTTTARTCVSAARREIRTKLSKLGNDWQSVCSRRRHEKGV